MPKQIDNLEQKIIDKGRDLLFSDGYSAFSMRRVAKECGIAVGTIYNYVKSKEDLIGRIAVSDWHVTVESIRGKIQDVKSLTEGIRLICREVSLFRNQYREFFFTYPLQNDARKKMSKYHPHLREEITEFMLPLLPKNCSESVPKILAELVLVAATRSDITDEDIKVFIDLLKL